MKDTDLVGLLIAAALVTGGLYCGKPVPQPSPPVPSVAPLVQPQPWTPNPTPPVVPTPKPPPRP